MTDASQLLASHVHSVGQLAADDVLLTEDSNAKRTAEGESLDQFHRRVGIQARLPR